MILESTAGKSPRRCVSCLVAELESQRSQAVLEGSRRDESIAHHGFLRGRRPSPVTRSQALPLTIDIIAEMKAVDREVLTRETVSKNT